MRTSLTAENKVSIMEAARRLGVSQQYVRVGIATNRFDPPIGSAVKMSSKWTYCIPVNRLEAYIMSHNPLRPE